ncbi:hypothetical protein L1049_009392 [Liquidambar formosana]|uniref:ALOG domain-containing protein n=1 Tax=Liquidambar formosana TaxID=63359 RepID=A0AAP0X2W2_LIQFO
MQSASSGASDDTEEGSSTAPLSRYESQKRRDWTTFLQYLKNHKPPLSLIRCSGANVIEFMKYLDQFGKTRVHVSSCPYFGCLSRPATCSCPLKQAWGSLDALVGRLRAAYDEDGGRPDLNPFGSKAVRTYLKEVRDGQAKARGMPCGKKRKRSTGKAAATVVADSSAEVQGGSGGSSGDPSTGSA